MRRIILGAVLISSLFISSCTTPSIMATRAITMGDQYNNLNDYNNAILQYEEYLRLAPTLGVYRNPAMEANILRRLAHAYSTQGKYEISKDKLVQALAIDNDLPNNKLNVIEDERQLGIVYSYLGEYDNALSYLQSSISSSKGLESSLKDDRKLLVADTWLSLAQVNLTLGNYTETRENIEIAKQIYETIRGEVRGIIETDLLRGLVHLEFGEIDDGIIRINNSRDLATAQGFTTARQLNALANAYSLKGLLEDELKVRLDALKEAEKSSILPQIIMANIKIGDTYQSIGDKEKANEYYRKALDIQQNSIGSSAQVPSIKMRMGDMDAAKDYLAQSNSNIGAGTACLRLGDGELAEGNRDEALKFYLQAAELLGSTSSREGQAQAALKLASLYLETDELDKSEEYVERSIEFSVKQETNWQALLVRGRLEEKKQNYLQALKYYESSASIVEGIRGNLTLEEFKTSFLNDKAAVFDHQLNLLIKQEDLFEAEGYNPREMAFTISEKARARTFLDMVSNKKIDAKSSGDEALLNKELELRKKIEKLNKELQRSNNRMMRLQLNDITDEYLDLLDQIKLQNASYSSIVSIEPSSLAEIREKLPADAALIEFWLSDLGSYVFILTHDKLSVHPTGLSRNEILRNVTGARNMIKFRTDDVLDDVLTKLYVALIEPIEAELEGIKTVGIVPHSSLHFMPFQALRKPTGEYLVTEFDMFYVPSASVFATQKEAELNAGKSKLLSMALGDLQLGGFTALPGTKSEIEHIGQIYDDHVSLLESESSEGRFKTESGDSDMIHIATHGTFNRFQPLYSYLLMSPDDENDGLLTVNEIFDLDLSSELVILSACETGLGDLSEGDELTGLSRAFLYAGSPAIIVSLWKVDDASTSLLMTRLHQYIKAGYPTATALSLAQRDLMDRKFSIMPDRSLTSVKWSSELSNAFDEPKSHPYFWAPFVLIGSF